MAMPPRIPVLAVGSTPVGPRTLADELGVLLHRLGIEAVVTSRTGETLSATPDASSLLESTDLLSRRVVEVRLGGEALCVAVAAPPRAGVVLNLTPRQQAVIELIAEGLPNHEIAQRLGISLHTVRRHVEGTLRRLNVTSRAAAAVLLQQTRAAERSGGVRRVQHAQGPGQARDGHPRIQRAM